MMHKVKPGHGQESVWDYPRPPALEKVGEEILIVHHGHEIARSVAAFRVLETSHPPVYYIPQSDINMDLLALDPDKKTYCEWKGHAVYWDLSIEGQGIPSVAWSYPDPVQRFSEIRDYLAFYPSKVDECFVAGERVKAQQGDFYGGWITSKIVGPFKGGAGTWGW